MEWGCIWEISKYGRFKQVIDVGKMLQWDRMWSR